VVGLKIGASQIAAAVVAQTNAGNELLDLTRRSLEAGIVVDGEVRDETALASALKAFFDDHKLPRSDVWIGLSSNRIGVRTIDMPAIGDKAQFDNAVRFKAHEVLPVALSESVLDYRVLSEYVDENAKRFCRVLLAVAPRDQVEPYQRVAEQAGLKLAGADLEALGLLRAFVAPRSADNPADTATVVVSIGHESSTLLVAGAGACEFTRVFDWGGNVLLEAIASTLEVRPAEAATMLRHLSLAGPGRQYDPLDESGRARATEAVRQRLTPFARELVNSLQFYQTQAGSLGIGEILITGGTSHLEGVDAVLQQMIGVGVQIGDPFARVIRGADLDPAIESSIGSLAVPIGLALHDDLSRGVNLLPRELARKRDTRSLAMAVGLPVAALIPLAALALTYTGAHGRVSDRQSQLDAIESQIAALPKPTKPVIAAGVATDEATRATAVASVLGGRLTWESVFSDLGRILPENVWLTNLTLTAPDGTAITAPPPPGGATTPTGVQMQGFTYSQPDVALLLARLATVPSLQRVTLTSSLQQPLGSRKVVHFVIVADLNQTGGAS
jgi:type IV pilus assembly protein PilM